jgi:hypothetical protein
LAKGESVIVFLLLRWSYVSPGKRTLIVGDYCAASSFRELEMSREPSSTPNIRA